MQELFKKEESVPSKAFSFQKKITLLDMTRARNMEILLGSLRLQYNVLKDAIMSVNDDVLTPQRLNILRQCIPTEEEIEVVQTYHGDKEDLGMAERFVLAMSEIPRLHQRLHAIMYRRKFKEELDEIIPDMNTLHDAVVAVRRSPRLKKVLQAVLIVGNFLNSRSTFRAKAYGFQIEMLLKLKDTVSFESSEIRDRAPTLLHYIVRRLDETDEDALDLNADLGIAELASKICIPELLTSVRSLAKGIESIKRELDELDQQVQTPENDWFRDVMQSFVVSAEVEVEALTKRSVELEDAVYEMLEYFGEDVEKRQAPPEDFFRIIWDFQQMIEVIL